MNHSIANKSDLRASNNTWSTVSSTDIKQLCVTLQRTFMMRTATPTASNILIIILHSCLSVFAAVVNLSVMIALGRKEEFETAANLVLKSMALSDFLVGLLVQPLTVVCHIFDIYGLESCNIKIVNSYFGIFCVGASMFSVTMFSVDRCFATWFPFRYQEHFIYKKYFAIIVCGWIFLLFFALMTLFKFFPKSFISCFMELFFSVCILAICFCYVSIYKEVKVKRQTIHVPQGINQSDTVLAGANGGNELANEVQEIPAALPRKNLAHCGGEAMEMDGIPQIKQCKQRDKITSMQIPRSYTVVVILAIFLLCYLPVTVVKAFVQNEVINRQWQNTAFEWTNLIVLLNSSINPVIYCIRVQKIRAEIRRLLSL